MYDNNNSFTRERSYKFILFFKPNKALIIKMPNYGDQKYWEERYKEQEGTTYDWYYQLLIPK